VNSVVAADLTDHGLEVLNVASFMMDNDIEMARITTDSIRRAAIEVCPDPADSLFVSCTALRAVEALEDIETALGRPVVSSIQAELWQSIRLAGYQGPIEGPGALLREHR
jgi:maleate isomerase